jgi:hypothetical protein
MSERLHIFAVNATLDLCHTHYTRAQGAPEPALPPLADWLGGPVDTDEIELFAIKDIGDLRLSDYVDMAFGVEGLSADDARRMDALEGSVLLVPDRALGGPPAAGAALTLIASPSLVRPDHRASLPKADVRPGAAAAKPSPPPAPRRGSLIWVILALALIGLAVIWGLS